MFDFFTHYPSRILHVGGTALGACILFAGFFLLPILTVHPLPFPRKVGKIEEFRSLPPLLPQELEPRAFSFDPAQLEELILLSLCPRRPDDPRSTAMAHIQIKGSNQSRQISLPGKIGLAFNDRGDLCFREEDDRFWLELKEEGKQFFASLFLDAEGTLQSKQIRKAAANPIVKKMEDLFQEEPFQVLARARWLGVDLVCKAGLGAVVQKVEVGLAPLDIPEGGRLYWDGSGWGKTEVHASPLVQVHGASLQSLEIDVWDGLGERHMRVAVPLAAAPPSNRVKAEEWFSSVRIRSDKQISCLLEKQCLILREGDWVLKENGRWRPLRKEEDKQQVIQGKRLGELILLESIDAKRRCIQGQLILANRIHGFPFTLPLASKGENKLSDRNSRARGGQ